MTTLILPSGIKGGVGGLELQIGECVLEKLKEDQFGLGCVPYPFEIMTSSHFLFL